jgi:hypothetical protein
MEIIYNKNNVLITSGPAAAIRFGSRTLPTTSSQRGGDTILRDKGFHDAYVKSEGLFSTKYHVVLSYYFPEGAPDEIVWTTSDQSVANEVVAAIKQVLG